MKMLALNIQQLPGGGYMLAYTTDTGAQMQAYSACSTLAEVFHRCVLPMAQQQFAEQPLTYQASQPPLPPIDDGTLPRVATGPARQSTYSGGGLLDRIHTEVVQMFATAWWVCPAAMSLLAAGVV
jgi:hypothetical protein